MTRLTTINPPNTSHPDEKQLAYAEGAYLTWYARNSRQPDTKGEPPCPRPAATAIKPILKLTKTA